MESQLNLRAIKEYSAAFAIAIADQAFASQQKIDGKGILSVTPVRQVNLLVINHLMNQWKTEMQKIRSPYFNFEEEAVQESLQEFMNTLSQHIAVDREHLLPLLEHATEHTLMLLLDPSFFYFQVLSHVRYSLTPDHLHELFKYIKINRFFPDLLLQHLQRENKEEIHASYALWLLDEKADQIRQHQEHVGNYLKEFSTIKPAEQHSFFHRRQEEAPPSTAIHEERKAVLEEGPKTLNDFLNVQTPGTTLVDLHQKRKIENIRSHIGVNQGFMFIRELFGNSVEEYNRALSTLDQQNTYAEAFNHIRNEYATKYRWRMDSEEVIEFLEIIGKRYV